jgi:hypothetical protein
MLLQFTKTTQSEPADKDRLDRLAGELAEIKAAMQALRSRQRAVLNQYQAEVRRRLALPLLVVVAVVVGGEPPAASVCCGRGSKASITAITARRCSGLSFAIRAQSAALSSLGLT